jgi:hypothetical protein
MNCKDGLPFSSSFIVPSSAFNSVFLVLFAVVVEACRLVVNDGFEVDGAAPESVDVFEHAAGVSGVEFRRLVLVLEV